jgi:hypothetical protein
VDRVAAKIAQKIRMFFQNDGFDSRPPEQVAEHHAGRAAARDTALHMKRLSHGSSIYAGRKP